MLEKLDKKLWEITELDWVSRKYNLQYKKDSGLISDLLHYKRILEKKVYCAGYLESYSAQDIAKKLLGKLDSGKHCLCFRAAPPVSTTSSTTTTTTT